MNLRCKLIAPLLVGYILLALLMHFVWLPHLLEDNKEHYQEHQQELITSLQGEISRYLITKDLSSLYSILDSYLSIHKQDWLALSITDKNKNLIYPLTQPKLTNNINTIQLHSPLFDDNEEIGSISLTVDWSRSKTIFSNLLNQLEIYIVLAFIIIIIASLIWQTKQISKPLLQLKDTVSRLASGDFNAELPPSGKDEIGQLNAAFAEMNNDLKAALHDTKESEAQQRAIINTIGDGVILIDETGIIENINPAAERIFGYDLIEVLGKNINTLIPIEGTAEHSAFLDKYLNTRSAHVLGTTIEIKGLHNDGLIFPMEITVSEVILDSRRLFAGVIRNITQRKKTEAELQLAAASFDTHEGILISNSDGNIIKVNTAFTKITGYLPQEVVGRNPNILKSGRHDSDFYNQIWSEINNKDHWSGEIWNQRKNGEIYPEWLAITAIRNKHNEIIYYIGNFLDISQKKTQQLHLKEKTIELEHARDEAEAAGNAKTDFLATMSHEIRTPMNGVLGMAQLLASTPLNTVQTEYLDIIQNSGKMLLNIINDILDFSKIDADKMQLELISFDLQKAAYDSVQLLSAKAQEKGFEIIFNYSKKCPVQVIGDAGRIRQIIINLLGNAIKFTQQGHVLLDIRCESYKDDQAELLINITDTGIGIPKEAQSHLFESFAQADGSTTRKFGGTGLGLAICKKLIELMGGKIGIDSTEGEGSTFWFRMTLPVVEKSIDLPNAALDNKRILIVDDSTENLTILSAQLERFNATPIAAKSAQQALHLIQQAIDSSQTIDLAIIDFLMPEMNGKDLGKLIRQHENDTIQKLPLILLTSCANRGDAKIFKQAGFNAYLPKPADMNILRKTLETCLAFKSNDQQYELLTQYSFVEEIDDSKIQTRFDAHILLAEDDSTNQKVASAILQQLGFTLDIANNGQEAVQMFKENNYALILMDCRMPELDGYEATLAIRTIEQASDTHIPIIALTANIQLTDQQKCKQAGMDDFLGKPFSIKDLQAVLSRCLTPSAVIEKPAETTQQTSNSVAVDKSTLDTLRGAMGQLFEELIPGYIQDTQKKIETIQNAPDDTTNICMLAHSLKSSSATIGAIKLSQHAFQLEQLTKEAAETQAVLSLLKNISNEFAHVKNWLEDYK